MGEKVAEKQVTEDAGTNNYLSNLSELGIRRGLY